MSILIMLLLLLSLLVIIMETARPWYYSVNNFQDFWTVAVQMQGTLNTRA